MLRLVITSLLATLAMIVAPLAATAADTDQRFALEGDRIEGGDSTSDAVSIEPGQYVDTTRGTGTSRYYLVAKPTDTGLAVSATARPASSSGPRQQIDIELLTASGKACAKGRGWRSNLQGRHSIISGSAYFSPLRALDETECAAADALLVHVHDNGSDGDYDFELSVTRVPAVKNPSELPAAIDDSDAWEKPARAEGSPESIAGGATLNDAPQIQPGRYHDEIRTGEVRVYRVRADWGQAPRVTFTAETDPDAANRFTPIGPGITASVATPLRQILPETNNNATGARASARYNGDTPSTVTAAVPQIRFLNVTSNDGTVAPASIAGDYYFIVELSGLSSPPAATVPLTIAVEVDGEPAGQPDFGGDFEGPGEDGSFVGGVLPWALTGLGLLFLVAAIVVVIVMLRRTSARR